MLQLAGSLVALSAGGRAERAVGLSQLAAMGLTLLSRREFATRFTTVEWRTSAVDLLLLLTLIWIASRSPKRWPVWMAAIHGFTVAGHVAKALDPSLLPNAYQTLIAGNAWLMVLLLIGATTWSVAVERPAPGDESWSEFSSRWARFRLRRRRGH